MLKDYGYYHSIESMGTLDGPGLRFVLFLQGCNARCLYCHNPDTWKLNGGKKITVNEVYNMFMKKKGYYKNGGITISGGEPLLQIEFLIQLCSKFKSENIHVCIDTAGMIFNEIKLLELIKYVDLFLVDIKTTNLKKHEKLTAQTNQNNSKLIQFLNKHKKFMWIRHVVVPGLTNTKDDLINLGKYVKTLDTVLKLQLLPYHNMAVFKYEELNIKYPLKNTKNCSKKDLSFAQKYVNLGLTS